MAKNITILEGRETRTFGNVEKITTNLAGGGTQNWIPEDEAADYVDADELSVDENGYYEPEAGTFYNAVDVNVEIEPELEEITITENGTYTPEHSDGFSSVSVEVDSSGSGDDPEVHGQEVTATATVDINAGDTVAIQEDSHEPVSVSCPLADRFFDQYGNASAVKFDGHNIYWVKYVDLYTLEVRKKPIANIEADRYTTVATIPNGWRDVDPWYCAEAHAGEGDEAYNLMASVFTNKTVRVPYNASGVVAAGAGGKAISVYDSGIYDKANKKVNDLSYANANNAWRMISGARAYVTNIGGNDFAIQLVGGTWSAYDVTLPEGVDTLTGKNFAMVAGNNALFIGYDSNDSTTKSIIAAPFDESEYDIPRQTEGTVVCDLDFSSYTVGSDTTYDRWAIATDNGLIVIRSDLSYEIYDAITAVATPYLVGDYVFIGQSCYKLTGDGAKMVPTSSKGTDGSLGVAKHNVRAGEEGTAIVLFT